ncbi:MAG: hypothetical protein ACI8XM_002634, partial [Haloarculaceae archaeon]
GNPDVSGGRIGVYWSTEALIDIRRAMGTANSINSSVDQYNRQATTP